MRATRAAKLGARYGRLLRLLKLLKFTRFLPCFLSNIDDEFEPTMKTVKRISEDLSARLSLRTAFLTLLLVIIVPFLNYTVIDYSPDAWLTTFKVIAKNETVTSYDVLNIARKAHNFYHYKDSKVRMVKIESPFIEDSPYIQHYYTRNVIRSTNIFHYESDYKVNGQYYGVKIAMDETIPNEMIAMFNIILILLAIIVLFTFTASFNHAVNELVVKPLEKMIKALRNSAMIMIKSLEELSASKGEVLDEKETDKDKKKKV